MGKHILTGEEFFDKIIESDGFYVDKTLFIKELLEKRGAVTLITRPRRFGKSLNMNTLKCFFDIGLDSRHLFEGLKIMEHSEIVEKHMNKYPVLFFSLKDIKEPSFEKFINSLRILVSEIFQEYMYLSEDESLNLYQKKYFHDYCDKTSTEEELKKALSFLTNCLYAHHKKRVIVLLDEYDTPINNSLMTGYYADMIGFMSGFMGSVFKSNKYLEFGVLTGVQRIAQEGLMSCFNNPKVFGIMDEIFATAFGFTSDEVKDACRMYGLKDEYNEVERWYNGYRIGGHDIFNPWSIVSYLEEKKLLDFWTLTGGVNILADIFSKGTPELKDDFAGLLTGKPIKMIYNDRILYPFLYKRNNVFWSMLFNTGYLKPCVGAEGREFYAELVNQEIKNFFKNCVKDWFEDEQKSIHPSIEQFVTCLLNGNLDELSSILNDELLNDPSSHDFKAENSYHMFIFGILLSVSVDYTVLSNPETGKGRSDCLIKPKDKDKYAVVIEMKHCKKAPAVSKEAPEINFLEAEAQTALEQIENKDYIHMLKREGYTRIYKYGIAFHKKSCEVLIKSPSPER